MMKNPLELFKNMLYPSRCAYCNEVLPMGKSVCAECERKLPRIYHPCRFCGREKADCRCNKAKHRYDGIVAPFYYKGIVKSALLRLKKKTSNAGPIAAEIAAAVKYYYQNVDFDCIAYVPIKKSSLKAKGFDHSRILADELSKSLNIPRRDLLEILIEPEAQHDLPKHLRHGNVRGIYDIKNKENLEGLTILLIDDIKTTGASLDECALMLKLYNAEKVYAAVAAVTD